MKSITTNEGAVKFHLNGQLIRTVPKGSFTTQIDWKRESVVVSMNGTTTYYDFPLGTTIDGDDPGTLEDLADALSAFSRGGTEPGGDGVQSVTGDLVDNTNPLNPKINMPVLDDGEFLVGGASGNEQRKILPTDIGLTANNTVAVRNSNGNLQGWAMSSSADNSTIPVRTPTGQGKFTPATSPDEAVVLSQHQSGLESKVDKVSGKVLSDNNFTSGEKSKLAGLEDVHYKGGHPNLLALETKYPTADEGSHAFVDDVSGAVAYIWDVSENSWVIRAGESTELTPAQAKVLYESNPDTNAFTDDEKSKLASITSAFTTVLKTAYDNAFSWITANGANILNHLSNKSNPHDVTASQVGLGNVDNTKDTDKPMSTPTKNYVDSFVGKAWIPDYTNMENTNRITSSGGSWTSDRKGFVYVLSRGYNASIYNTVVVTINGKEVGRVWVEATSGTGTARSGSFSNIYPVKPGDVVTVIGNLEVKCLFIPGILV